MADEQTPGFTPGPWTFDSFSFGGTDAPISHKKIVGPPYGPHGAKNLIAEIHMNHPNHEADGRLIASAPELLEALEEMVRLSQDGPDAFDEPLEVIAKAREAILKARGAVSDD